MEQNPYLDRIRQMPAYGRYHRKVPGLLNRAISDEVEKADEDLYAAVHVNHGSGSIGYLAVTSDHLWYLQSAPLRRVIKIPLAGPIEITGVGPMTVIKLGRLNFQARTIAGTEFKEFVHLVQTIHQAMVWDIEHTPPDPVPVVIQGGGPDIASQLAQLTTLHKEGHLTDAEFEAAKHRLLEQ